MRLRISTKLFCCKPIFKCRGIPLSMIYISLVKLRAKIDFVKCNIQLST
jgi:hypothetical protein